MKILLTGATGYIGSAWLESSLAKAADVVKMEGRIPDTNPEPLLEGVDVVVHLAARTPSHGKNEPAQVFEEERMWAVKLGSACKKSGTKLVFVSSSSIYAGREGESLSEETEYIKPITPYAVNKYAAEKDLQSLATKGLCLAVLRFGSVFGVAPTINWDRAVNAFVKQAVRGQAVTIWRPALAQVRPYTHIDDSVSAINFVIEHDLFSGEVYNVVSANTTVREILSEIEKHTPPLVLSVVDDERMSEYSFGMDDTKFRMCGFVPHGSLSGGISALCDRLKATHD